MTKMVIHTLASKIVNKMFQLFIKITQFDVTIMSYLVAVQLFADSNFVQE